jgi:hypothetical protein
MLAALAVEPEAGGEIRPLTSKYSAFLPGGPRICEIFVRNNPPYAPVRGLKTHPFEISCEVIEAKKPSTSSSMGAVQTAMVDVPWVEVACNNSGGNKGLAAEPLPIQIPTPSKPACGDRTKTSAS